MLVKVVLSGEAARVLAVAVAANELLVHVAGVLGVDEARYR